MEWLAPDLSALAETPSPTIHRPEIGSESRASVAPSWQKAQRKKAGGNRDIPARPTEIADLGGSCVQLIVGHRERVGRFYFLLLLTSSS